MNSVLNQQLWPTEVDNLLGSPWLTAIIRLRCRGVCSRSKIHLANKLALFLRIAFLTHPSYSSKWVFCEQVIKSFYVMSSVSTGNTRCSLNQSASRLCICSSMHQRLWTLARLDIFLRDQSLDEIQPLADFRCLVSFVSSGYV